MQAEEQSAQAETKEERTKRMRHERWAKWYYGEHESGKTKGQLQRERYAQIRKERLAKEPA